MRACFAGASDTTTWASDVGLRVRCLRQLHEALVRHREELRDLIVAENGLPVMLIDGGAGLDAPTEMVLWHADLLEKYEFTEDLGVREPVGVVGAIVPYNYPVQITLAKLAPALAAGCSVVVKGPPEAPWITASLGKLIAEETDIPAGVVNVLFGSSPEIGEALTTDPRVDLVSFTGSTATGRRIMAGPPVAAVVTPPAPERINLRRRRSRLRVRPVGRRGGIVLGAGEAADDLAHPGHIPVPGISQVSVVGRVGGGDDHLDLIETQPAPDKRRGHQRVVRQLPGDPHETPGGDLRDPEADLAPVLRGVGLLHLPPPLGDAADHRRHQRRRGGVEQSHGLADLVI